MIKHFFNTCSFLFALDSLFVGYKERKLNHDLERGSKKALKNVAADIRKKLGE
ncbi:MULTISPECIES: hypothetical protein [Peribacillus]|uniref:hypothetical protein n=1 Tax=Peribacillus TaxID=2675229 RepID=UPI003305DEA4